MLTRFLLFIIHAYQRALSPFLAPACRFEPSCSHYMEICVERFGAARGLWLGSKRLLRCHPFHPGGYDPPPASLSGRLQSAPMVQQTSSAGRR